MPTYPEIVRSLEGALLLAKGEPRGLELFDLTIEGFWKSFAAALVAAPAYVLVLLEQYAVLGWPQDKFGTAVAELVAYACGWITFPIAAIFLTRLLNLSTRYVPLVVAGNWSSVVQIGLYTVVVLATLILPGGLRPLLLLAATLAVMVYQWFVIRTALLTGGGIAFGLLVIDTLLSVAVSRTIDGLLQPV